ncbi:hypothetical protein MIS45_05935 [Wielerella bovis]|uniref:hypothetical protein n=1 Tax=Wielerella bovis TaxID=2917790 RepID=UPI00201983A1|nr:hypothetical protein [Wielerella bovis]ULJ68354.1 hypothetical protein MIS45_05935 [Wielerella bovis]
MHIDFAQREITFWQNQKCIQKIELGLPSSLMYKQQPLCFSVNNKLIKLNIYDKNSKGHLLWQMETAVLFGKTEAKFLQQIDDLTGKMAKKLNLTLFYEKTSV